MRLFTSALCTTIAIGLLAGCAGNMSSSGGASLPGVGPQARTGPVSVYDDAAPIRALTVTPMTVPLKIVPLKKKKPKAGIYVSVFGGSDVYGYPIVNKANKKPICTISGVSYVNGLGVDSKGNLMEPDGGSAYLIIHKGPYMCSNKLIGEIADTYGQPSDASSPDAATGKIALGTIVDTGSAPGSVAICTVKAGCTANLSRPEFYHTGGVAMSNSGDCWNTAKTSASGGVELVYWKGCTGSGQVTKGFKGTYYGGIDIDDNGNLVVLDLMAQNVYIYKGCNPKCTVVGGPFTLQGQSFFGKLNKDNSQFAAVDRTNATVDVYSYSTKALKYEYSFSNGLVVSGSQVAEGIAYNPRSQQ